MKIVVEDIVINYLDEGRHQEVILLLHGWADQLTTFDLLAHKLSNKYRVIRLDLPGFGQSTSPKTVWGLEDYAKNLAQFINKLEIKQINTIIGHSNGGALAVTALGNNFLDSKKLVLIAAAGIRNQQNLQKLIYKLIAKVGKRLVFFLPTRYKQELRRKLYGTIGSDLLVAPHLQETFKKTVKQDVSSLAQKITQPTLLLFADHDPAIPLQDGISYNKLIASSKLVTISSNSHFFFKEQENLIMADLDSFLKS